MSMQIKPEKPKLFGIQALRAVAAAMVVYVHALSNFKDKIDPTFTVDLSFSLGELGVKLFFCISGFIIYTTTKSITPSIDASLTFFKRRLLRVVPIYWLFTVLYAIKLSLQGEIITFTSLIKSLLFIPYAADGLMMRPIIGQGWTLNYEMFFYTLFAVGLIFAKYQRAFWVSLLLVSLIYFRESGLFDKNTCIYYLSDFYLIYFLMGIVLGIAYERKLFNLSLSDPNKFFLISVTVFSYIAFYYFMEHSNSFLQVTMALFCLLTMLIGLSSDEKEAEKNMIENKVFNKLEILGNASYSTYITHGFIIGAFARLIRKINFEITAISFSIFMIIICSSLGVIVYRYIEIPLIGYFNRYFNYSIAKK